MSFAQFLKKSRVRGHYRTLASGKRVWVNPHERKGETKPDAPAEEGACPYDDPEIFARWLNHQGEAEDAQFIIPEGELMGHYRIGYTGGYGKARERAWWTGLRSRKAEDLFEHRDIIWEQVVEGKDPGGWLAQIEKDMDQKGLYVTHKLRNSEGDTATIVTNTRMRGSKRTYEPGYITIRTRYKAKWRKGRNDSYSSSNIRWEAIGRLVNDGFVPVSRKVKDAEIADAKREEKRVKRTIGAGNYDLSLLTDADLKAKTPAGRVLEVERMWVEANLEGEIGAAFSADGYMSFYKVGGKRSVTIDAQESAEGVMSADVFTHYHPSGSDNGFSPNDLSFARHLNIREMRAVTYKSTYLFRAPEEGWGGVSYPRWAASVRNLARRLDREYRAAWREAARRRLPGGAAEILGVKNTSNWVSDELARRMAERYGCYYERRPHEGTK